MVFSKKYQILRKRSSIKPKDIRYSLHKHEYKKEVEKKAKYWHSDAKGTSGLV